MLDIFFMLLTWVLSSIKRQKNLVLPTEQKYAVHLFEFVSSLPTRDSLELNLCKQLYAKRDFWDIKIAKCIRVDCACPDGVCLCNAWFLSSVYILLYKMPNTWTFENISKLNLLKVQRKKQWFKRENHEELYKNNSKRESKRECFREFYRALYLTAFIRFSDVDMYQHLLESK